MPTPAATPTAAAEMAIHGHRGARALAPENTLPAFELALDHLVDVLELDLQLTREGTLVVWHDPFVMVQVCRAGGPPVLDAMAYAQQDFRANEQVDPLDAEVVEPDVLPPLHPALAIANQRADQLRKLKCDRNPNPLEFPDQKRIETGDYGIVSLDELFDFVDAYAANTAKTAAQRSNSRTVEFNIETKRDPKYPTFIADHFDGVNPGLFERRLSEVLEKRGLSKRTIVQSFDHRSLWAIQTINGSVRLSALTHEGDEVDLAALKRLGADIWSPKYRVLTPEIVAAAQKTGLHVVPYTVNVLEDAKTLQAFGVEGIITDRPDLIHRNL